MLESIFHHECIWNNWFYKGKKVENHSEAQLKFASRPNRRFWQNLHKKNGKIFIQEEPGIELEENARKIDSEPNPSFFFLSLSVKKYLD